MPTPKYMSPIKSPQSLKKRSLSNTSSHSNLHFTFAEEKFETAVCNLFFVRHLY